MQKTYWICQPGEEPEGPLPPGRLLAVALPSGLLARSTEDGVKWRPIAEVIAGIRAETGADSAPPPGPAGEPAGAPVQYPPPLGRVNRFRLASGIFGFCAVAFLIYAINEGNRLTPRGIHEQAMAYQACFTCVICCCICAVGAPRRRG